MVKGIESVSKRKTGAKMTVKRKVVELMMGLPSSGKSTYAQSRVIPYSRDTYVLDLDKKNWSDATILSSVKKQLASYKSVIIDMLLTSNEDCLSLLKYLKDGIDESISFVVHFWPEDKENCIKNDNLRVKRQLRKKSSIATINFCELDDPRSSKEIKQRAQIKTHEVFKQTVFHELAFKQSLNGKLRSSSWCLGGTGRNYMGDTFPIHGESTKEFDELDYLLLNTWPNIGLLQYKQVKRLAKIIEKDDSDYYSRTMSAYWEIDLVEMYELIDKLKKEESALNAKN